MGIPVLVIDNTPYRHTVEGGNGTSHTSNEWPRLGGNGPSVQNLLLFLLSTFVQVMIKHRLAIVSTPSLDATN